MRALTLQGGKPGDNDAGVGVVTVQLAVQACRHQAEVAAKLHVIVVAAGHGARPQAKAVCVHAIGQRQVAIISIPICCVPTIAIATVASLLIYGLIAYGCHSGIGSLGGCRRDRCRWLHLYGCWWGKGCKLRLQPIHLSQRLHQTLA